MKQIIINKYYLEKKNPRNSQLCGPTYILPAGVTLNPTVISTHLSRFISFDKEVW